MLNPQATEQYGGIVLPHDLMQQIGKPPNVNW